MRFFKSIFFALIMSLLLLPNLWSNDRIIPPKGLSGIDKDKVIELKEFTLPEYPIKGVLLGASADVWVRMKFSNKKKPDTIEVVYCSNPGLGFEEAAIKSALLSSFGIKPSRKKNSAEWWFSNIPFIAKKYKWYPIQLDSGQINASDLDTTKGEKFPKLVKKGFPKYPWKAQNSDISGIVYLRILVSEIGYPSKVTIKQTTDPYWLWGLNEEVIEAVKRCRFSPAIRDGKPIPVWITFPYEFTARR